MLALDRRQQIAERVEAQGAVTVRDLAQRFGVTAITIARDLQSLEEQGVLRRTHGGAINVRGSNYEPPYLARAAHLAEEKARIAARAAALVREGDSLILDVGTTALALAQALRGRRNLTVLVSNLRAAVELARNPAIQVIVIGGRLRAGELSMVGHLAESMLRGFRVDRAFIGVGGLSVEHGLTEFNVEEAGAKRAMLASAAERIILADHTKFSRVMLNVVAPLSAAHAVITGAELDAETAEAMRRAGVYLLLA